MPKIFNVVAAILCEILAIVLVYALWTPAINLIGAMTGVFKPIASMVWIACILLGTVLGPWLLLTQENLAGQIIPGGSDE
jgi:hypothetical protein